MRSSTSFVAGIVSLLLAIAGAYYIRQNYLASLTVVQVPVPVTSIAVGSILTPDMFVLKDFPSALVNVGENAYVQNLDGFNNMVTRGELPAGLPVPSSVLVNADDYRPGTAGEVLVAIPVNPVMTVGGLVKSGDFIDIYRLYTEPAPQAEDGKPADYFTSFELSRSELVASVLVIYTLDGTGNPAGRAAAAPVVNDGGIIRQTNTGTRPAEILVISAPRAVAEALMRLQVAKETIWFTLAENQ